MKVRLLREIETAGLKKGQVVSKDMGSAINWIEKGYAEFVEYEDSPGEKAYKPEGFTEEKEIKEPIKDKMFKGSKSKKK